MEQLTATPRSATGKGHNRRLRATGDMPAIVYGGGAESQSVAVSAKNLERIMRGSHKRNTLIGLSIDGADAQPVLVRELQVDPVNRRLIHVDFVRCALDQHLVVQVPVETVGRSQGEIIGGRLRIVRRTVNVRCLPGNIPATFGVDVTPMHGGDSVRFSECVAPEGIELVASKNDFVVVQCVKGRVAGDDDLDAATAAPDAAEGDAEAESDA
jgi:large subunit ribosomal protein L25